jgi:hypothetical protein
VVVARLAVRAVNLSGAFSADSIAVLVPYEARSGRDDGTAEVADCCLHSRK